MLDLVEDLREICETDTPIVQVFTYLWIRRTFVCRGLMFGNHYMAEDDGWVRKAREFQQEQREKGTEL